MHGLIFLFSFTRSLDEGRGFLTNGKFLFVCIWKVGFLEGPNDADLVTCLLFKYDCLVGLIISLI